MLKKTLPVFVALMVLLNVVLCPSAFAIGALDPFLASPRVIAMGGAYVAVADDANAVFLNPAGLGDFAGTDLSASYGSLPGNIKQYYYVGSVGLKNFGGLGFGYKMTGFFDEPMYFIDGTTGDIIGLSKVTAQDGDIAVSCGYRVLNWFLIGVKGHRLSEGLKSTVIYSSSESFPLSDYEGSGAGYGLDIGVLINPLKNFSIGFVINDLYATEFQRNVGMQENIPRKAALGISYQPKTGISFIAMDVRSENIEREIGIDSASMGGEFTFLDRCKVRVGYCLEKIWDTNSYRYAATSAAGLGFNLIDNIQLDYAWKRQSEAENDSHYFSVGVVI